MPPTQTHHHAFTRLELCATLAALFLLAIVAAPVFGTTKTGNDRAVCFNNLRLLGRAAASWAGDHEQLVPWRVPFNDGGSYPPSGTKPAAAWFEYSMLSNELRSPKFLACPAEGAVPAPTFEEYKRAGWRENSTSYSLSLEFMREEPRGWMSSDRNLRPDLISSPCAARVPNAHGINEVFSQVTWTNSVHGTNGGNVLLHDGSVSFVPPSELHQVLTRTTDESGQMMTHFLRGR